MTPTTKEIRHYISHINHEEELREIYEMVNARAKSLRMSRDRRWKNKLKVGDTIVLNDSIRPQYIRGMRVKVTELRNNRFVGTCPLDRRYRKFAGGPGIFHYSSIKGRVKA